MVKSQDTLHSYDDSLRFGATVRSVRPVEAPDTRAWRQVVGGLSGVACVACGLWTVATDPGALTGTLCLVTVRVGIILMAKATRAI